MIKRPVQPSIEDKHLPAPIGGINTIAAGTEMPPTDCNYLYNMVAAEYGLRSRLGYREWVTGITGSADNSVRTVIPFTGSQPNQAGDKLFVTTDIGIWDCTVSTNAPTQVFSFAAVTANSGRGISCVMVTSAGHFLLYCDEENGYHVYSENNATWTKIGEGYVPWVANSQYAVGDIVSTQGYIPWQQNTVYNATGSEVVAGGNLYGCTSGGTSASTGFGPTGTGSSISDGTVIWTYLGIAQNGNAYQCVQGGISAVSTVSAWQPATAYYIGDRVTNNGFTYTATTGGTSAAAGALGPVGTGLSISDGTVVWTYSLPYAAFDGPSGTGTYYEPLPIVEPITDGTVKWQYIGPNGLIIGVDPGNLAFVMVFKNRVWFAERDTSNAWILDPASIYGTPSVFPLGSQFRSGGTLVGMWNWTIDGGSGIDDRIVAVSSGGDVAIYAGTDPTVAADFGLVGTWFIGGIPAGRRIASTDGGDLLLLSTIGVLPVSKLVIGNWVFDRSQYATAKIANLFNTLMNGAQNLTGWSVRLHPSDNTLLVMVPVAEGSPTVQLAMSVATRGWSQYRDLPIYSSDVLDGQLYFGTTDGRVCINDGYIDAVSLAQPSTYSPVKWSGITSFQNLGNSRKKRLTMIIPTLITQGSQPSYAMQARYDFDLSEATAGSLAAGGPNSWDNAVWDKSVWGGGDQSQQAPSGSFGMGRQVAVAFAGNAIDRTILVSMELYFNQGGLL